MNDCLGIIYFTKGNGCSIMSEEAVYKQGLFCITLEEKWTLNYIRILSLPATSPRL